ncbi:MAG: NHL repeat-containing protein [Methanosarcinaceae archaeon]|nr:NHL repeat-containing protein [Methanosarcinaceae archaeon]
MCKNIKLLPKSTLYLIAIIFGLIPTSVHLLAQGAKKWEADLLKEPLPEGAKRLRLVRYFPKEGAASNNVYLAQGDSICVDKSNNIFVADSKANSILKFNINGEFISQIGGAGQGPGELLNPRKIFSNKKDTIYVENNGNGRLEIFSSAGIYLYSIKIFKHYSGYVVDSNGKIYANYMDSNIAEENLIEVLNKDGSFERAFGRRNKFKYDSNIHNEVLLSLVDNKYIFALWSHFNILKKYSLDGKLLLETSIKNNIFNNISEENDSMMKVENHSIKSKILFSGFSIKEGKLFILKQYPRLEIYECKENGDIDNVYWIDTEFNYIGNGLTVVEENKYLYFITVQSYPEGRIGMYSVIK